MKDIRERFEKEFGTRSDYFNHRLGLFMEMEDWIERECRKAAIEAIEKASMVPLNDTEYNRTKVSIEILKLKEDYEKA